MSMFRLVLVAALVLGCNVEPKDTTPVDADDTVGTIHLMIWTERLFKRRHRRREH